jgi:hypothetical protein
MAVLLGRISVVPPLTTPRSAAANEHAAGLLSGQELAGVRYFLLALPDDSGMLADWDSGIWHEPTMGVELVTLSGDDFSVVWGQYEWGFGVDLFAGPMSAHLTEDAAGHWVDVSAHRLWSAMLGSPLTVRFLWDDYGTGLPPCPEVLTLSTSLATAWIIAGRWESYLGRQAIKVGLDGLLVTFDEKAVADLGFSSPDARPPR